jgi:succinate-acetate transporter protein
MALTDVHDASVHKEVDLEGCSANAKARAKERYSTNGYQRNSVTMLAAAFGPDFQPVTAPAPPPPPKETFRTFGDPAPLGLFAYALTTLLLSLVNLGAGGVDNMGVVIGLFYSYAGVIQVLAGMWEMARGSEFFF